MCSTPIMKGVRRPVKQKVTQTRARCWTLARYHFYDLRADWREISGDTTRGRGDAAKCLFSREPKASALLSEISISGTPAENLEPAPRSGVLWPHVALL
jgi:hypothetical protein